MESVSARQTLSCVPVMKSQATRQAINIAKPHVMPSWAIGKTKKSYLHWSSLSRYSVVTNWVIKARWIRITSWSLIKVFFPQFLLMVFWYKKKRNARAITLKMFESQLLSCLWNFVIGKNKIWCPCVLSVMNIVAHLMHLASYRLQIACLSNNCVHMC